MPSSTYRLAKRALDIAGAAAGLVATAPIIAAAAVAIKATSPGPVFYRANRAGRGNRPFAMLKLRTMIADADRGAAITVGGDRRITRVGEILRKTKIDELPQFVNVLRGEMSLVGPRPEEARIVDRYYTDEQKQLLDVAPGIAAPGQVFYYLHQADEVPPPGMDPERFYVEHQLDEKLAYDMHYVAHASLCYDAKVIAQTVGAIACTVLGVRFPWRLERSV